MSLYKDTELMQSMKDIFLQMEKNCPEPSSTSEKLWECRRACKVASHNKASETLIEKAVGRLAEGKHMPGWYNQCPTASGIAGTDSDKRSNVDLVHWLPKKKHARLIELKIDSDDPYSALQQILRYGAAYLFCRVHRENLPLNGRSLMDARSVSLEVIAPLRFYNGNNQHALIKRMCQSINALLASLAPGIGGLSMSLHMRAFPNGFNGQLFQNGGEVKSKCSGTQLTDEGRQVRDAFNNATTV